MSILITGATGFIGRHVASQLSHDGETVVAVLRQPETQLPKLRQQVEALGGTATRIQATHGNLDQPELELPSNLPAPHTIIHLGARFAWGMDRESASRTNVDGSLAVAELARRHNSRLVFVSGFMLENREHMQRIGISSDDPERVNWTRVYRRAGAYEASKMEAALRVRSLAKEHALKLVEVQPATVAGHSRTGALDAAQPFHALIDGLARGRMALVPGSPAHWLPLVAVDHLAVLIARAATSETAPSRLLALDPATPNLKETLGIAAGGLGRRAPQRHLPISLLAALLRLPGVARLMGTSPEAMHFIQTHRFDTSETDAFLQQQGLSRPSIERVIADSARWYARGESSLLQPA